MNYRFWIFTISALFSCWGHGSKAEEINSYSGIIVEKHQAGKPNNMCMGNDYLSLEDGDIKYGIKPSTPSNTSSKKNSAVSYDELSALIGKQVTIEARLQTVTFKCDMLREQCTDWETTCLYLEVLRIVKH